MMSDLTAYLFRERTSDHGTEGVIFVGPYFLCYTLEPPDRDNAPNVSCIPAGIYDVVLRESKKYGQHFHVTNVEGRSWILEHSGNWGGDRRKGLHSHTWGCILLGFKRGSLAGQRAVLNSKLAVLNYMYTFGNAPHKLVITEVY